jgi:hypothetical protein
VLVVVDESYPPGAIKEAVAARTAGRPAEAVVVAPAAGSRLDRLTGDEAGYSKAARHLDETLVELARLPGLEVRSGKVGSHDPIQAMDESLREFPADEIVLAFDGEEEHAESRYGIPVTKLVAGSTERV